LARKNKESVDHELFDDNNDDAWQITQGANSAAWKLTSLRDMARAQLGTVGSGNHYVDIFEDEQGRIWVGVHFGSLGFGHKIATRFLTRAGAKDENPGATRHQSGRISQALTTSRAVGHLRALTKELLRKWNMPRTRSSMKSGAPAKARPPSTVLTSRRSLRRRGSANAALDAGWYLLSEKTRS
jgi:tRNA-splicing ligase RtcB